MNKGLTSEIGVIIVNPVTVLLYHCSNSPSLPIPSRHKPNPFSLPNTKWGLDVWNEYHSHRH